MTTLTKPEGDHLEVKLYGRFYRPTVNGGFLVRKRTVIAEDGSEELRTEIREFLREDQAWGVLRSVLKSNPWLGWKIPPPVPQKPRCSRQPTQLDTVRTYILDHPGEQLKCRNVASTLGLSIRATRKALCQMKLAGEVSLVIQNGVSATAVWVVEGDQVGVGDQGRDVE